MSRYYGALIFGRDDYYAAYADVYDDDDNHQLDEIIDLGGHTIEAYYESECMGVELWRECGEAGVDELDYCLGQTAVAQKTWDTFRDRLQERGFSDPGPGKLLLISERD